MGRPIRRKAEKQKENNGLSVTAAQDLRAFTSEYFRLLGAAVHPLDDQVHGPLRVVLPDSLTGHFGKQELGLAFHTIVDGSGHELVAHGSRMFDRMLALLDQRAALTILRLPVRWQESDALLSAVHPLNAGVASLRLQEQLQHLFLFNWRITYRADDKREEIFTIGLDASGSRLLQPGEAGAPDDAVAFDTLLNDGEPLSGEGNQDMLPLLSRLPPLAQLVRLAEVARKYAVYHADLRCVAHEAEILPRLYKVLDRLTTYYGQQIEEISDTHDPTGEKRLALEEDLRRKIAEEVENHRLRVQVELVSYAVLELPIAVADFTLNDGKQSAPVHIRLNRYSGGLQRPHCHACDQESSALALCRNGHVMCDGCVRQCNSCQDVLCATCGVEPCPVCSRRNCSTCGRVCWACGGRACSDHLSRCPVCSDDVCHACQMECEHCGVRQCRSHLRVDCVASHNGSTRLICSTCAVRCPGCRQYSAHMLLCSASGQRFCANCIVACAECGQLVGPGFYSLSGLEQRILCRACVRECPSCHNPSSGVFTCAACAEPCCATCGRLCAACQQMFCKEHVHFFKQCNHAICVEHVQQCGVGQEALCPICARFCAICERSHCSYHTSKCAWCGMRYCSMCVQSTSGLCDTCAEAARNEDVIDILDEPCGALPTVAALATHYRWRRASNRAVVVYLGVGEGGVVLVTAETNPDGKPRAATRRLSSFDLRRTSIAS